MNLADLLRRIDDLPDAEPSGYGDLLASIDALPDAGPEVPEAPQFTPSKPFQIESGPFVDTTPVPAPAALPAVPAAVPLASPEPSYADRYQAAMGKTRWQDRALQGPPSAIERGFVSGLLESNPQTAGETAEGLSYLPYLSWLRPLGDWLKAQSVSPKWKTSGIDRTQASESLEKALTYAGEQFGQGLASTVPPVVGGVVGAGVGAGVAAIPGAIAGATVAGLPGALAGAAITAPSGIKAGAFMGAALPSFALNYGDLYRSLKEEGMAPEKAAKVAVPFGAAITTFDLGGLGIEARIWAGAARKAAMKSIARRIIENAGRGAAAEGSTEAIQQIIQEGVLEVAHPGKVSLAQRAGNVVEAGGVGAMVGGAMGGPAGIIGGTQARIYPGEMDSQGRPLDWNAYDAWLGGNTPVTDQTAPAVPRETVQPTGTQPATPQPGQRIVVPPAAQPAPDVEALTPADRKALTDEIQAAGYAPLEWLARNFGKRTLGQLTQADLANARTLLEAQQVTVAPAQAQEGTQEAVGQAPAGAAPAGPVVAAPAAGQAAADVAPAPVEAVAPVPAAAPAVPAAPSPVTMSLNARKKSVELAFTTSPGRTATNQLKREGWTYSPGLKVWHRTDTPEARTAGQAVVERFAPKAAVAPAPVGAVPASEPAPAVVGAPAPAAGGVPVAVAPPVAVPPPRSRFGRPAPVAEAAPVVEAAAPAVAVEPAPVPDHRQILFPKRRQGGPQTLGEMLDVVPQLGAFVSVVQTANDLPEQVKQDALSLGHKLENIEGAYNPEDGKVYLVQDALTTPEAARGVIAHEVAIHKGLETALGKDGFLKVIREVWENLGAKDQTVLAGRAKADGLEELQEESVAYEARRVVEAGVSNAVWHRAAAQIRPVLRRLRFRVRYSDLEIAHLVSMGWEAAVTGKVPAPEVVEPEAVAPVVLPAGKVQPIAEQIAAKGKGLEGTPLAGAVEEQKQTEAAGQQTSLFADNATLTPPTLFSIAAYHGTPHTFEKEEGAPLGKFRKEKVGTGEGAAAYGWGVAYVAENPEVSKSYQQQPPISVRVVRGQNALGDEEAAKELMKTNGNPDKAIRSLREQRLALGPQIEGPKGWQSREENRKTFQRLVLESAIRQIESGSVVVERTTSNLYHVEVLAEPEEFLDWDKPLRKQSETVGKVLAQLRAAPAWSALESYQWNGNIMDQATGRDLYSIMVGGPNDGYGPGKQGASMYLNKLGIKGIRYLDQGSRGEGKGTYNYVVFNEDDLRITGRNGEMLSPTEALGEQQGGTKFSVAQEGTPEFKRWFGSSVVTKDGKAGGEPLVAYHGTSEDFTVFGKTNDIGYHFGDQLAAKKARRSTGKKGEWKIGKYYLAIENALDVPDLGNWRLFDLVPVLKKNGVIPSEVRWDSLREAAREQVTSERPDLVKFLEEGRTASNGVTQKEWDSKTQEWSNLVDEAQRGVIVGYLEKAGYDGLTYFNTYEGGRSWIALHREQIKSATGNVGTFSPTNPDIRYSVANPDEDTQAIRAAVKAGDVPATEQALRTAYANDQASGEVTPGTFEEWMGFTAPALRAESEVPAKVGALLDRLTAGQAEEAVPEGKSIPPGQKERRYAGTLEGAGLPPGVDATYEPIENAETEKQGKARVKRLGVDGAEAWLREPVAMPTAEHQVVAAILIANHQYQANEYRREAKAATDPEARADLKARATAAFDRAVAVSTYIVPLNTQAGQFIQAAKLIMRLDPAGIVLWAQRRIEAINRELAPSKRRPNLTEAENAKLQEAAQAAREWADVATKAKKAAGIVGQRFKDKPIMPEDLTALRELVDQIKQATQGTEPTPAEPKSRAPRKRSAAAVLLEARLDKMEAAARDRIKNRGIILGSGIPADLMGDYVILGAAKMGRGAVKFADWSVQMAKALPADAQPHLKRIYAQARSVYLNEARQSRRLAAQTKYIEAALTKAEESLNAWSSPADMDALGDAINTLMTSSVETQIEKAQEVHQLIGMLENPSFLRKVSTIQTEAQLLNPKTIVTRNPLGNEILYRVDRLSRWAATPFDYARSKITGGERLVTFRTGGLEHVYWRSFLRGARLGWKGIAPGGLLTQFELGGGERGPAFRGKGWMQKGVEKVSGKTFKAEVNLPAYFEKAMGATLRGFDYAAYQREVMATLGELGSLEADRRGYTGKGRDAFIRDFAANAEGNIAKIANEAGKWVTFQDASQIAKALSGLKRGMNFGKEFGLGDIFLKYPKTPGNILDRAVSYSPAGFVRSAYIATKFNPDLTRQEMTRGAELELSRALVGSVGLSGLGMYLVAKGVLTARPPKDREAEQFITEQTGQRTYQVNLSALGRWGQSSFADGALTPRPGDRLYSWDWAQPVAANLAIGANIEQAMLKGDEGRSVLAMGLEGVSAGLLTLEEQSVLQGVKTMARAVAQGGKGVGSSALGVVGSAATAAGASFVPTLLNQVRTATDNTRRVTYAKNPLRRALNLAIAKVPFVADELPAQRQTYGGEPAPSMEPTGSIPGDLFQIFLSPGFLNTYKMSPDIAAIIHPYTDEGETTQFPRRVPAKIKIGKQDLNKHWKGLKATEGYEYELTGPEMSAFQEHMGSTIRRLVQKEMSRTQGGRSMWATKLPSDQLKGLTGMVQDSYDQTKKWYLDTYAKRPELR